MGLDMRPLPKGKPGYEERAEQILRIIFFTGEQPLTPAELAAGIKPMSLDEMKAELEANSIKTYETIKAPKIGRDAEADQYAREAWAESDKSMTEDEFLKKHEGYHITDLAKEKDGIPVYVPFGGGDVNVFRGSFLKQYTCDELLGKELVGEAWQTKLAADTLDFGNRLMAKTDEVAATLGLQHLKDQRLPPQGDNINEHRIHIGYSLARWLIFYGKNGHGYEAWF